jgi:lipopolysaccharide transport system permease protein
MLAKHYLQLVTYKAYADLRSEAAKTSMGFLWWVLDPLLFMVIFYVVFGLIMKHGTENFLSFLLIGLVAWRWFQNTVSHGANSILGGRGLMHQVYVPKIVFPLVIILTDLVKFSFVFSILLLYLLLAGFGVGHAYLALPVVLLVQFTLIVGLTLLVSALVPFLPDLKFLNDHLLHVLFYMSGIFFAGSSIAERYQPYFYLNPMANLIEAYRDILMHNAWPNWSALVVIAGLGIALTLFSGHLIGRNDHLYPKWIPR